MRRGWLVVAGVAVGGAVLGVPSPAVAGRDDWNGGAWLHYEASYVHRRDPAGETPPPGAGDGLAMVGLRLKGFISRTAPVGILVGVDLHAGSTNPGGFAYQADLYLLGMGARLGERGTVGVGTGVGASGAVGTADDAVELPLEAFLELGVGSRLRLLARGRAVWLGKSPGRDHGAPHFDFADEVDGTLAIRFGHRYTDFDFPSGNGYFLGAQYREWQGAQFIGAVLGYSVDIGTP